MKSRVIGRREHDPNSGVKITSYILSATQLAQLWGRVMPRQVVERKAVQVIRENEYANGYRRERKITTIAEERVTKWG